MEFNLNNMCDWERKKAIFLLKVADELDFNLNTYGELSVNQNSGYTYLWSENYNFTLYMPIDCELRKEDIYALWSCPECGEEIETQLTTRDTLQDIEESINEIEKRHMKEAHNQED